MSQKRRSSRSLEKASVRYDGIKSFDPKLDAGGGYTAQGYLKLINQLRTDISNHNATVSELDALKNRIDDREKELSEYSEKMLIGVAYHYGNDSNEYEMAGGVRKRDRKRPTRKVAVTAT
ncbi:MAG: hypothetical protein ACFB16_20460 [Phormidesmis sp.]